MDEKLDCWVVEEKTGTGWWGVTCALFRDKNTATVAKIAMEAKWPEGKFRVSLYTKA